jgi:hypothetical protein
MVIEIKSPIFNNLDFFQFFSHIGDWILVIGLQLMCGLVDKNS